MLHHTDLKRPLNPQELLFALHERHPFILKGGQASDYPWRISIEPLGLKGSCLQVGRSAPIKIDGETCLEALDVGLLSNRAHFLKGCFLKMGVNPDTLIEGSLKGKRINGSPASLVFLISGEFKHTGKKSIVCIVSNQPLGSTKTQNLESQFRGIRFLKYNLPTETLELDGPEPKNLSPREYTPEEIVQPLAMTNGNVCGRKRLILACAYHEGYVELNRLEGAFVSNEANPKIATSQQSIKIGFEVARVLAQAYAATYDPIKDLGFLPRNLSINLGDIIIKADSFEDPKVAICAACDCVPLPAAALVNLIISGRNIDWLKNEIQKPIIEPNKEGFELVKSALGAGFQARFGIKSKEYVRRIIKSYANKHPAAVSEAEQYLRSDIYGMGDMTMPTFRSSNYLYGTSIILRTTNALKNAISLNQPCDQIEQAIAYMRTHLLPLEFLQAARNLD